MKGEKTMTEDLRNKVIIVTGASTGIGKHLSLTLLQKGSRVVACARHNEWLGVEGFTQILKSLDYPKVPLSMNTLEEKLLIF